ncbi:MAG: hypothetical protein IT514_06145 [Burkholderiales bacterium]|nr:hypothetical protein [Burkholderiales bacterium]
MTTPGRAAGCGRPGHGVLAAALVLLFAASSPSAAQTAARQGASLGRLFFTPAQREELDRRRQLNIKEEVVAAVENRYTVNGRVARSSGRSTTWVNGAPRYHTDRSGESAVISMEPGETGRRVDLKVGQTFETGSGEVRDVLRGGTISIRRAPGAGN